MSPEEIENLREDKVRENRLEFFVDLPALFKMVSHNDNLEYCLIEDINMT